MRSAVAMGPLVLLAACQAKASPAPRRFEATAYSGTYVVTDTGAKIAGRKIDIYIPGTAAATRGLKKNR